MSHLALNAGEHLLSNVGQRSPTFSAPGTGFMEDNFSHGLGEGGMVSG